MRDIIYNEVEQPIPARLGIRCALIAPSPDAVHGRPFPPSLTVHETPRMLCGMPLLVQYAASELPLYNRRFLDDLTNSEDNAASIGCPESRIFGSGDSLDQPHEGGNFGFP